MLGREAAFDVHDTEQKPGVLEMLHIEQISPSHNSKCMTPILRMQARGEESDRHH